MAYGLSEINQNGVDYRLNDPNVVDEFSTSKAYSVGEYANYNGLLYKFNVTHPAGEWNTSHVTPIKIGDEVTELKVNISKVVFPNLMGMTNWTKYPVDFRYQKHLTISTSDGSIFPSSSDLRVLFYDGSENVLDYWTLKNEQTYRTISISETYRNSIKYLGWNGSAQSSVPLMVNYGSEILPYVEYKESINKRVSDLSTSISDLSTSVSDLSTSVEDIADDVTTVSKRFVSEIYQSVPVRQGALKFADGTFNPSDMWCFVDGMISSDDIITTTPPLRMYLIAFDAKTLEYIGVWNGNTFATTYVSSVFFYSINISEWVEKYPNYAFSVEFYSYSTLTPSLVYSSMKILKKRDFDRRYNVLTYLDGWEQGSWEGSRPTSSGSRLRYMKGLRLESGSTLSCVGTDIQFRVVYVNDVGDYIDGGSSWETNWTITDAKNVKILVRKNDESAITLADIKKLKLNLIVPKAPELSVRVVPQYSIGDCMVLKTSEGGVILIDIGREQDYTRLKNALYEENITSIDYVIISHYHGDHISTPGMTNLIADFDLSNCKIILPPPIPDTYSNPEETYIYPRQTEILALLEENNIDYINTYDYDMRHMYLCGIQFDFYNLDHDSWYEQTADYNQMSIVCVANIGKNTIFFTGDMGQPLETKLMSVFDRSVNIAKFGHHGLNTTINTNFWHRIKPEVIFSCSPQVWHDELYLTSHQIRFANYNGIKNIMTNTSGTIYIHMSEDGYSISGYNYKLDNLASSEYFDYIL